MKSLVGALASVVRDQSSAVRVGNLNFGGRWSGSAGLSQANTEAYMRQYGAVSTLFAIVDRLVTSTAKPVWHLMRAGTEQEVTSHPCIDLWNQPNDFYTQNDFIEAVQQHMDLVGEMWWIVARSTSGVGPPLELWPVRPDRMQPVPDPEKFISGYIYSNGTEKVPLELTDVITTRKPNPLDPYRGIGPVQTIMTELETDKYSAAWNANFFRNSALPGGIIEFDGHLDDQQFEEFVLRWREQHQGVANAHRVAVLEKGKFQELKYSHRDMQFDKLRQASMDTIATAFGFPMHMLGKSEHINRANAEAQEVMFAKWLIVPRLERIKQLLNTKLLPMYGSTASGLEWVYEDPTPEDKLGDSQILAAASTAVKTLIDAGFDPEEVLAAAHLPPIKFKEPPPPPPTPVGVPQGQKPQVPEGTQPPPEPAVAAEYVRLLNKVRDDSKREMTEGWQKRLESQGSAFMKFLEKRWG